MPSFGFISTFVLALSTAITASPVAITKDVARDTQYSSSGYWLETINRQGTVWGNPGFKIFRNVKDYGAVGDGVTDDTAAINKAIADGARCGSTSTYCDSSTIQPAIVYFPTGKYRVTTPIRMLYYTQLIGNALAPPTLLADAAFTGMAVVDSDPYNDDGSNLYTNQNNFFRQVRNFVIDISAQPETLGAGIHWQVAQATSLQNLVFNMRPASAQNKQTGIFMDNGSGGYIGNLTFNGGNIGAFLGSQQFTSRDLTFNGCNTAIYMNWNWGWTFSDIKINNAKVGLDMANSPSNMTVGSVVLSDSVITNTAVGLNATWNAQGSVPASGGNLVLDNVDMSTGVSVGVQNSNGEVLLAPCKVSTWTMGNGYYQTGSGLENNRAAAAPPSAPRKAASLLDPSGKIFGRNRPQYETLPVSSFKSAKADGGCKGDGATDDTACIQAFLTSTAASGSIAYFDHGAYIVTDTIKVPASIKITGEIWPLIVAKGFNDVNNPKPVFQVGQPGQTGAVEISDMIFETTGDNAGAIVIEWNLDSSAVQGSGGLWDVHVRIGGSYGTQLQSDHCGNSTAPFTGTGAGCQGVFLMLHVTSSAKGLYLENTWYWVADHDLDLNSPHQISIYSGRGVLVNSPGPTWLWGTASEHSMFYNYQFKGAQDLFSGFMQSETPYFQPNPENPTPFSYNSNFDDPDFSVCWGSFQDATAPCKDAWGLRVWESSGILIYGTGMYSFFNNYDQGCVAGQNCQQNMIHIQNSKVDMYAVSTKGAVNMIVDDWVGNVKDADNRSNFCGTIAFYNTDF
ncbi:hypothetical protein AMS68_001708 [Peltaster fructicola]|uniref:Rhamnogalacturonase A/B/Epimerase-like pectate lyase domain-containing protein n=1 Tax=Peltaster fructicola TaxID=286661 RepID=A0A6H0XNG1_9PEZI|nr:hypothetical protein AMS68_001708 [Peltaster fructicola]